MVHTCKVPTLNEMVPYSDGPCDACAAEKESSFLALKPDILQWVQERYDNCIRIAAQKTGEDKKGWLDDASYFWWICEYLNR